MGRNKGWESELAVLTADGRLGDRENVGLRIKAARLRAHMKQGDLAERIGKSRGTILQYEAGSISPPLSVIECISDVLNVDPTYLTHASKMMVGPVVQLNNEYPEIINDSISLPTPIREIIGHIIDLKILTVDNSAPQFGIEPGDAVLVDGSFTRAHANGQLYAVMNDNDVALIRSEAIPITTAGELHITSGTGASFRSTGPVETLGLVVGSLRIDRSALQFANPVRLQSQLPTVFGSLPKL